MYGVGVGLIFMLISGSEPLRLGNDISWPDPKIPFLVSFLASYFLFVPLDGFGGGLSLKRSSASRDIALFSKPARNPPEKASLCSSLDAEYGGAKITSLSTTAIKIDEYAQKANLAGRE